jgi:hypothetical protein
MFPNVIRVIILDYASTWELRDWIARHEISWENLAANTHPRAIEMMIESPEKTDWVEASTNPEMWPYLEAHPDLICYDFLDCNPNPGAWKCALSNWDKLRSGEEAHLSIYPHAITWLKEHPSEINWHLLSGNPAAEELLTANPDKISWSWLHINPAPWAIELIKKNPRKHNKDLSRNPAGFDILMERANDLISKLQACIQNTQDARIDRESVRDELLPIVIDWYELSKNTDLRAVSLALTKPNLIVWSYFSKNPSALESIRFYDEYIDWETIFENPSIFELRHPEGVFELL